MANANLNSALYFIKEYVVQYIGFNVQHIKYACSCTFHARGRYKGHSRVDHATYVYMTHLMYLSGCHGVTPTPYVIDMVAIE